MPTRTPDWKAAFGRIEFFMRQAVEQRMSFNEFYRLAQEQGLSYRRERMLADWRDVQGLYRFELPLQRLRPETVIPTHMISRVNPNQRANYLVGVKYERWDPVTARMVTEVRVIMAETLEEKYKYEEAARSLYAEGAEYQDPTATNFRVSWVTAKSEALRR